MVYYTYIIIYDVLYNFIFFCIIWITIFFKFTTSIYNNINLPPVSTTTPVSTTKQVLFDIKPHAILHRQNRPYDIGNSKTENCVEICSKNPECAGFMHVYNGATINGAHEGDGKPSINYLSNACGYTKKVTGTTLQ